MVSPKIEVSIFVRFTHYCNKAEQYIFRLYQTSLKVFFKIYTTSIFRNTSEPRYKASELSLWRVHSSKDAIFLSLPTITKHSIAFLTITSFVFYPLPNSGHIFQFHSVPHTSMFLFCGSFHVATLAFPRRLHHLNRFQPPKTTLSGTCIGMHAWCVHQKSQNEFYSAFLSFQTSLYPWDLEVSQRSMFTAHSRNGDEPSLSLLLLYAV